jgi:hypothetical protein
VGKIERSFGPEIQQTGIPLKMIWCDETQEEAIRRFIHQESEEKKSSGAKALVKTAIMR